MPLFKQIALALSLVVFFVTPGLTSDSDLQLNLDVKEFRLNNGMLFLIVERPTAPQVAARLAIRAGSALEESGKTGIAHMLEHMLFKGTKNFGTLNYKEDQALLPDRQGGGLPRAAARTGPHPARRGDRWRRLAYLYLRCVRCVQYRYRFDGSGCGDRYGAALV